MVRLSRQALRRRETLQSAALHDFAFLFFLESQSSVCLDAGVGFDRHSAFCTGEGNERQPTRL